MSINPNADPEWIGRRWLSDSTLATWFPFTAKEFERLKSENRALKDEIKNLENTINTLHNLCVSAERRALEKFNEEQGQPGGVSKANRT